MENNKINLTNTFIYALVGIAAGIAALFILVLLTYLSKSYQGELNIMACFVWAVLTINYKINLKKNWIITIVDVLAMNIPFISILLIAGVL